MLGNGSCELGNDSIRKILLGTREHAPPPLTWKLCKSVSGVNGLKHFVEIFELALKTFESKALACNSFVSLAQSRANAQAMENPTSDRPCQFPSNFKMITTESN